MDDSGWSPAPQTIAWLHSLPLPPGRSAPTVPTSRKDWDLVEQYRLLVESLYLLGQYEATKRQQERLAWEQRADSLAPQVARLNFGPSPEQYELALAHGRLPLAVAEQSSPPAPSQHTLTSFLAALEDLETRIGALNLEVAETRNMQLSLEEEAAKRAKVPTEPFPPYSKEDKAAAVKLEQAVQLLGRKSVEYQQRLNELKKHIPAGYEPALTQLQDHSAQYEQFRAEKGKLTALGESPSDQGLAPQLKVEEKREVKGLRRTRDQLLSQKGTGAA